MEYFEIETISRSIKNAIDNSQPHYEYIESVQHRMEKALNEYLDSKNFDALYKEVSKYDKSLARQIEDLMEQRNSIVEGMTLTQKEIFEEKNLNRNYFTIMLFGRTMAGKSTTIQAFLGKNLEINGNGTPDWTKDISVYDWAGVRLVDTPGIEGFDSNNFDIASNYIEQSDMVIMVISDDHIEPVLIEKMANLLKENKPFAVILNVKAGNPRIVLKRPEKIIRDDEVNGHIQRIRDFLSREFASVQSSQSVLDIPIFPVYMEGAFRAQVALSNDLCTNEEKEIYYKLYKYSRFDDVIRYLTKNIIHDASLIKSRSVYDSFICRLEEVIDVLVAKVYPLKRQTDLLKDKRPTIKRDLKKINKQLIENFYTIQEIFDSRISNVDAFVDKYIDDGAKGNIKDAYKKYLIWDEIKKAITRYQSETVAILNAYVVNFEEDISFDLNIVSANASKEIEYEFTVDTKRIFDANVKKVAGKVLKTVGRTAAGVAPSALIGWGVANFWNPTGWAAFAAGAGTLIVGGALGYYGSEGVKHLGNQLDGQGKREIAHEKAIAIKGFKKELQDNYSDIEQENIKWLSKIVTNLESKILGGLDISIKESNVYVRETYGLINHLSDMKNDVLKHEIDYVLSTILTENEQSVFNVHRVVRKIGRRLKIALIPTTNKKTDIIRHVLGDKNQNLYKLRQSFGREIINLVGLADINGSWHEKQVIEAIGVKTVKSDRVSIVESNSKRIVTIRDCSKKELGLLYDRHKINKKLSQELLSCTINYEEEQSYGSGQL